MSSRCNNCPDNCLGQEVSTLCTFYEGPDIPELGIKCGDALNKVLLKVTGATPVGVVEDMAQLKSQINDFSADSVTVNNLNHSAASTCALAVAAKEYTYKVTDQGIEYDYTAIENSLPEGYSLTYSETNIQGREGTVENSRGVCSLVSINIAKSYPLVYDADLRISSPCGPLCMRTKFSIPSPSARGTYKANMEVSDINSVTGNSTQLSSVIQSLCNEVQYLKNNVNSLKIEDIGSQVHNLQLGLGDTNTLLNDPNNFEIDYNDGTAASGTIQDTINDLYKCKQDLESQLHTLKLELEVLRNRQNGIADAL